MLDHLKSLAVFATVVEEKSFRGAGKILSLSPSVVSHHISKLENDLGTALILRSTRRLTLTDDGKTLYKSAAKMLGIARKGLGQFSEDAHESFVKYRIAIPSLVSSYPIFQKLLDFAKDNPGVHLQIISSDNVADLIKNRFDLAIRMGVLKDSELKSRKIGEDYRACVVSRSYFEKMEPPQHPRDLESWDFIRFTPVPPEFSFKKPGQSKVLVHGKFSITSDSIYVVKQMALEGMGVAGIPYHLVKDEIASGELIQLFPDWEAQTLGIYGVWVENVGVSQIHKNLLSYLTG